ncbi:MAG: hypothetical protein IJP31_11510 [Lachnospiraceae bacterium]|nr:hypothetical protein [Lachnospiraceae bacterium]
MGEYTKSLDLKAKTVVLDEADDEERGIYAKILYDNARAFRGFDQAMIVFLSDHGYAGDPSDIKAMAKFVRTRFAEADVPPLHNFRDLFNPGKGSSLETAFKICFAFQLTVQETNDFFKRVMFERGIDCHLLHEAACYFGLKHRLPYRETVAMIQQIPKGRTGTMVPTRDVLYTVKIVEDIEGISEKENLIRYLTENLESFAYNNAGAIKFIQFFWSKIIGPEGLAVKEGELISEMLNSLHPEKEDDFVISSEKASTWTIYCQIMGLDKRQEMLYSSNRSLSPVFTDNVLLPLKASDCFPSQQIIDGILRGEFDGKYEKFRKMLIFLAFYTYWAKILTDKKDIFYCSGYEEGDRCKERINKYLADAGYPELYPGNPYDWIFLWSMNDDQPLNTFRAYMREVYIAKTSDIAEV